MSFLQRPWRDDQTVPLGTSVVVNLPKHNVKVGVQANPGGGGTVTVKTTMSPQSEIDGGTAVWTATTIAASATAAVLVLDNVYTALQLTAATANGVFAIVQ